MQALRSVGSIKKLILVATLLLVPVVSFAGVFISVGIAPPALPVYTQPVCPGPGYIWTPGYWAYGDAGYYWVPGVWVVAPRPGLLWTPGYWGWSGAAFVFHEGYWGPHIGFYGGVNYGFGYGGVGFEGGYWRGGVFTYNRAVANVGVNVTNVYTHNVVVNNVTVNRVSYNGGAGGLMVHANEHEQAAFREQHVAASEMQMNHIRAASMDRSQLASVNGGRPQMMAARTPDEYHNFAQKNAAAHPITERDRAANQQQRIGNGVKSGQLTPHETANLEKREASINHQAAADRAANGGRLTPQEHQQINQRQNNVSNSINNDKHNAATDKAVQHQERNEGHGR
jgi:WXXGXW repeat (2 copies)